MTTEEMMVPQLCNIKNKLESITNMTSKITLNYQNNDSPYCVLQRAKTQKLKRVEKLQCHPGRVPTLKLCSQENVW